MARPSVWSRVVGGIDWGYVHAFAAEIVAESGSGRRATIAELYTRGQLLDELIPELLELQERYDIETYFADPSEPAYIEHCRRMGVRAGKRRSDGEPRVILLLSATRHNRDAVRSAGDILDTAFGLDARRVLAALRSGLDPGRDALIMLRVDDERKSSVEPDLNDDPDSRADGQ